MLDAFAKNWGHDPKIPPPFHQMPCAVDSPSFSMSKVDRDRGIKHRET